jgi:hypothetical protein
VIEAYERETDTRLFLQALLNDDDDDHDHEVVKEPVCHIGVGARRPHIASLLSG